MLEKGVERKEKAESCEFQVRGAGFSPIGMGVLEAWRGCTTARSRIGKRAPILTAKDVAGWRRWMIQWAWKLLHGEFFFQRFIWRWQGLHCAGGEYDLCADIRFLYSFFSFTEFKGKNAKALLQATYTVQSVDNFTSSKVALFPVLKQSLFPVPTQRVQL